jgi:hypothetical protein
MGTRLTGKVAIVTGSGQGIGRAIAIDFGREADLNTTKHSRPPSTDSVEKVPDWYLRCIIYRVRNDWLIDIARSGHSDIGTYRPYIASSRLFQHNLPNSLEQIMLVAAQSGTATASAPAPTPDALRRTSVISVRNASPSAPARKHRRHRSTQHHHEPAHHARRQPTPK